MMMTGMSSLEALETSAAHVLLALLTTLILTYIFHPALSLAASDAIVVEEELISEPLKRKRMEDAADHDSSSSILLSIVIPAYNEEARLPKMLDAAVHYVQEHQTKLKHSCQSLDNNPKHTDDKTTIITTEWIIVSDGSTDATEQVARDYGTTHASSNFIWRLVALQENGGKGAAVKAGMLRARGALCLMVDADGATEFGVGLERLLNAFEQQQRNPTLRSAVAFGSRAHLEKSSTAKRSVLRTFLMKAFHFFVHLLCSSHVHDTQCGFKLFPRDVARRLFGSLHLQRWAFDTELVMLADRLELDIVEVNVPWHEVDGSKLHTGKLALAWVSIGMLRDMLCVRACYTLGIWRVKR